MTDSELDDLTHAVADLIEKYTGPLDRCALNDTLVRILDESGVEFGD